MNKPYYGKAVLKYEKMWNHHIWMVPNESDNIPSWPMYFMTDKDGAIIDVWNRPSYMAEKLEGPHWFKDYLVATGEIKLGSPYMEGRNAYAESNFECPFKETAQRSEWLNGFTDAQRKDMGI